MQHFAAELSVYAPRGDDDEAGQTVCSLVGAETTEGTAVVDGEGAQQIVCLAKNLHRIAVPRPWNTSSLMWGLGCGPHEEMRLLAHSHSPQHLLAHPRAWLGRRVGPSGGDPPATETRDARRPKSEATARCEVIMR